MKRFFLTSLFFIFVTTSLSTLTAMDHSTPERNYTFNSTVASIKTFSPEMQLYALCWMIAVDTPEAALASLDSLCNCALIDTEFALLADDKTLAGCLKERLKNTDQTLITLCNHKNETIFHCLAHTPKINRRVLSIIQLVAGDSLYQLLAMRNCTKESPLHIACQSGFSCFVETFFSNQSVYMHQFVFMKDDTDWTPLHMAANKGNHAIVKILLQLSAPYTHFLLTMKDDEGCTPVHIASSKGLKDILISLLTAPGVQFPAILKIQDEYGNTPRALAQQEGHQEIVLLLMQFMNQNSN